MDVVIGLIIWAILFFCIFYLHWIVAVWILVIYFILFIIGAIAAIGRRDK